MKTNIELFKWFWNVSRMYTGYKGPKLYLKGIIPCIRFMRSMNKAKKV